MAARRFGFNCLHLRDARLPRVNGCLRSVERPVALVRFLALAEPHHRENAREVRGEVLEHVGNPFCLVAAPLGTRNFGDEQRLVDVRERVICLLENLRECLPAGPALARAPVVAVDGNVIDVVIAGVVARKRCTAALVRGVRRPDPFDVRDAFFLEDFHDMAECFGDVSVGIAGACLAYAPVVPVAVRFVERPEPDFFAVAFDTLGVVADVAVGLAVDQILRVVAVRHPGHHKRGTVVLRDICVLLGRIPVVDVEEREVADEVEVRALQILEGLHVLLGGLRVLPGPADPGADLEC